MSDERALKLLEAFSGVEEELLERCENAAVNKQTTGKKKKVIVRKAVWQYGSAVAAVLCIAIVGLAHLGGLRMGSTNDAAYEAIMQDDAAGAVADSVGTIAESVQTMLSTAENATMESDRATDISDGVKNGSADFIESADAKSDSDSSIKEQDKMVAESEEEAPFPKPESATIVDSVVGGNKKYTYIEVTEAEARVHDTFGAYVPTEVPEGYVLEGAYVSGEGEEAGLMVSWTRGMDSIMVNITLPKEVAATVDIAKIETYDEYLYEIPHAETVPEDYREVFNNPVCAWEDFSLEFVQKRMISRGGDAGDTDTPRGNFSVLYPDGVLVYFNGRGTAEEIWELFASMNADN